MKKWFIFLTSLVIAGVAYQLGVVLVNNQKQVVPLDKNIPANMKYQQAIEFCKPRGIFSIDYEDYESGVVKSVYCSWK